MSVLHAAGICYNADVRYCEVSVSLLQLHLQQTKPNLLALILFFAHILQKRKEPEQANEDTNVYTAPYPLFKGLLRMATLHSTTPAVLRNTMMHAPHVCTGYVTRSFSFNVLVNTITQSFVSVSDGCCVSHDDTYEATCTYLQTQSTQE